MKQMQTVIPLTAIQKELRAFKLSGMVSNLEIRIKQATEDNLGYAEFLSMLSEDEKLKRADNKRSRLYRRAHLPYEKGLEDFDFTFQPSIKKQELIEFSTCRFIDKRTNLLFIGQPGTGKTHLSVALALAALGRGKTVLFTTIWDMINVLQQSRADYYNNSQIPHLYDMIFKRMKKILLTVKQHKLLARIITASTTPQRYVLRCTIILAYATNNNKSFIARKLDIDRNTVRHWIVRWQEAAEILAEKEKENVSELVYIRFIQDILADAQRPGAPATFTQEQKQQIRAMASEKPEKAGAPVTHWTHKILAEFVQHKGIVKTISSAHLGRFLKEGSPQAPSE